MKNTTKNLWQKLENGMDVHSEKLIDDVSAVCKSKKGEENAVTTVGPFSLLCWVVAEASNVRPQLLLAWSQQNGAVFRAE